MNLNTLVITPELLRIISEIDEFNGGWKMQGSLNPDYLTQLRHVATIESIGSSTRIEGAKLEFQPQKIREARPCTGSRFLKWQSNPYI